MDWNALPRTVFDPLFTALVVVAIVVGGIVAYPVALLMTRGDSEKRGYLCAWVVMACMLVFLAYVNILIVIMWPIRFL